MADGSDNKALSIIAVSSGTVDLRLPYAAWAWEYLRRNRDYRRDWRAARYELQPSIHLTTGARLIRERRRWRAAEKWGLLSFADPEHGCDKADIFWRPDMLAGALPVHLYPLDTDNDADDALSHDEIILSSLQSRRVILETVSGVRHILLSGRRFWVQLVCDAPAMAGERCAVGIRIDGVRHYKRRLDTASQLLSLYQSTGGKLSLIGRSRDSTRLAQGLMAVDIIEAGGRHRDVAEAIYGKEKVAERWGAASRYYEDWSRRLIARAFFLVNEGYRDLLAKKTL